jgi:hypothetical protein
MPYDVTAAVNPAAVVEYPPFFPKSPWSRPTRIPLVDPSLSRDIGTQQLAVLQDAILV